MGVNDYFFDSYALIELIKGNPNYFRYKEQAVNITLFNLVEVAYSVFLDYGKDKAQEVYKKFREYVQDVDEETLFYALELKTMFKKRHLSYADCIGYAFARKHSLRFLTGDKEFENMAFLEFVR